MEASLPGIEKNFKGIQQNLEKLKGIHENWNNFNRDWKIVPKSSIECRGISNKFREIKKYSNKPFVLFPV